MRLAGIAHMRDVAWAIVEPRGKISFIQRDDEPSPQPKNAEDDGAA